MTKHLDKIQSLLRHVLASEFEGLQVVEVNVREDEDSDGGRILLVDVIFDAARDAVDAKALTGAVRKVRPKLIENREDGFPVFSFIARDEMSKAARAGAGPY